MNLQQTIDSAVKDFRDKFQNPKNTGYRVGQEFLGAVEFFIISSIKKAVEEAFKAVKVEQSTQIGDYINSTEGCDVPELDIIKEQEWNAVVSLIEKKKSQFLNK